MSIAKIRSALVQAFENGAFDLPTVYENTDSYTPQANTPWCQFIFIPNQPNVLTLGSTGEDEHTGLVRVLLNYPLDTGSGAALLKADEIRAVFKAGTTFTYDGQSVMVRSCGVNQVSEITDGFHTTAVTITWRALTAR